MQLTTTKRRGPTQCPTVRLAVELYAAVWKWNRFATLSVLFLPFSLFSPTSCWPQYPLQLAAWSHKNEVGKISDVLSKKPHLSGFKGTETFMDPSTALRNACVNLFHEIYEHSTLLTTWKLWKKREGRLTIPCLYLNVLRNSFVYYVQLYVT